MLALVNRSSDPPASPIAQNGGAPARSTDAEISALQAQVRAAPEQPDAWAQLGDAYLQKVRETGDASFYARADGVLRRALALEPDGARGPDRHRHARARPPRLRRRPALRPRRPRAPPPDSSRPLGVIVDAQVELGRYDAAATHAAADGRPQAQPRRRTRASPTSASSTATCPARCARCGSRSPPAATRPRTSPTCRRCSATSSSSAATLGAARARLPAGARRASRGYVPAQRGTGARRGGARGDSAPAIRRYRGAVARLPLPEYVIGARRDRAGGRPRAARRARDLALVGARAAPAAAQRGQHRRRARARSRPTTATPARAVDAGAARVGRRAERALRRRARLGADPRRAGRATGFAWARRALRLGSRRPDVPLPRGHERAGRRARRRSRAATCARSLARQPALLAALAPRGERALEALR